MTAEIDGLEVRAYTVPTNEPESDGTLAWDATTVVTVEVTAAGHTGLGFSYATTACAKLITDVLAPKVIGKDCMQPEDVWEVMVRSIRNFGRPGLASMSIAALDTAIWDLKARVLEVPLSALLGAVRTSVPIYGSGGFTSYDDRQLTSQLTHWVEDLGVGMVKIKIGEDWGRNPQRDVARVALTRRLVGDHVEVFVDANGGYTRAGAIEMASRLAEFGVSWFEEPVSSDDLVGLGQVREATTIDVTAGEYAYDLAYVNAMCGSGAVDVMQLDVTRCAGITEWLRCAAAAAAHGKDISSHCAQSLHLAPACATPHLRHIEYFHDHERVERLLFDGVIDPANGKLHPDTTCSGTGLSIKSSVAQAFRVL